VSHLARQEQIHHLWRIIRELSTGLPEEQRADPDVGEMISYGGHTSMHIVSLLAPRLEGDDYTKDIDFSESRLRARWNAGYAGAQQALAQQGRHHDPLVGTHVHDVADT
jgi:NTE family protein